MGINKAFFLLTSRLGEFLVNENGRVALHTWRKPRSQTPRACFSVGIKCIKSFSAHDQSRRGKSNLENTLF